MQEGISGIEGSKPDRFGSLAQKRKGFNDPSNLSGGFKTFFKDEVTVDKITTCRKKTLNAPTSKEYEYKSNIRLFPNRKTRNERPRGIRRVDNISQKNRKNTTGKKRFKKTDEGIFGSIDVPKPKKSAKKILSAPKLPEERELTLEKEIQKKKRIKLVKKKEPKKISKINLQCVDKSLEFRNSSRSSTENVSPFDPKMTLYDKKLLGMSKKKIVNRDKQRYLKDEENMIKNLKWNVNDNDNLF